MIKKFERETRENTSEFWSSRIKDALTFFQQSPLGWRRWQANIELYSGEHYVNRALSDIIKKSDLKLQNPKVPITTSSVNSFVPFLTSRDPKPIVKAVSDPAAVSDAEIATDILQQQWKNCKMKKELKKIVKDSLVFDHGIGFAGYEVAYEEYPESTSKTGALNYRMHILKDNCALRRIDPFRFIWEPDSPDFDLDSARWCCEILFVPRQDVMDNENYSDDFREATMDATPATHYMEMLPSFATNSIHDGDLYQQQVILYHVWDKKFMFRHIFCEGVEIPAYKEPQLWPYRDKNQTVYLDSFPYKKLDFITNINSQFGIGMPALMEDQQLQLNKLRKKEFAAMDKSKRIIWYNTDIAGEDDVRKIMVGEDLVLVPTKGPGTMALGELTTPSMPSDWMQGEAIIKQDIRESTGESELQRGGSLPSGTTATEIQARKSIISLKTEDVADNINEFVNDLLGIFLKHIIVNFPREKVKKIVGMKAENWLMQPDPTNPAMMIPRVVTAEELKEDYSLECDSVASEILDPTQDKQQRMSVMQMSIQSGLAGPTGSGAPVKLEPMFKWVMEAFDIKELSRWFSPAIVPDKPIAEVPPDGTNTVTDVLNEQQQIQQQAVNTNSQLQGQNGPNGGV